MTAYLIVRAEVPDPADRQPFDRWYQQEHLPDAVKAFQARKGWRGWSTTDPKLHYAVYEFADLAQLQAIQGGAAMLGLIAEFDRAWGKRVTRSREVVDCAQAMPA